MVGEEGAGAGDGVGAGAGTGDAGQEAAQEALLKSAVTRVERHSRRRHRGFEDNPEFMVHYDF